MAVTQKAPLASAFRTTVTRPAWRDKPSWYQISSQDRMITPENQTWMSGRLNARKVITLDASHASLASRAPGSSSADRRGDARLNSGAVALAPRCSGAEGPQDQLRRFSVLRPHYANCGKQAISPMKPSLVRYLRPN